MQRVHQKRIGELFDQLQVLMREIEVEPSYFFEYPDQTKGPSIQVVMGDLALAIALDQLSLAAELARQEKEKRIAGFERTPPKPKQRLLERGRSCCRKGETDRPDPISSLDQAATRTHTWCLIGYPGP
jgi:hypothetical protein